MKKSILLFFILLTAGAINAQKNEEILKMAKLKTEIIKMDSLLFTVAFNECKVDVFKKIIADDIEFFDDRSGLNNSKDHEVKTFLEKCARTESVTRKLNSTIIDKLGDYGAVQLGEHTFLVNNVPVGTAKFIHIWERKNNEWILKRIVSYEHRPLKK